MHANNQSIKVLKKNNLRSDIVLSLSSKHLLFFSLQRHCINGEQLPICDQFNDDQTDLANKLEAQQQTLA